MQKSEKKLKIKYIVIILFSIGNIICFFMGCFSTINQNKIISKKELAREDVVNYDSFYKQWNKKIYDVKYSNTYLPIDFSQYVLTDKSNTYIENKITKFINYSHPEIKSLQISLENSKYKFKYIPIIEWLKMKNDIKSIKHKTFKGSGKYEKYIADTISPHRWFSNNTIDKILQMNEFCYYFDKNKDKFYNNGYTRNIKSCKQLQFILDKEAMQLQLFEKTKMLK